MTSAPVFQRFALAYSTGFALIYVIARAKGLALFTVYPSLGILLLGTHRSRDVADPILDFLAPEMLVGMDCHGRAWRSRDRLYSRAVARSLVSPILAGMDMGGADPLNDRVRLSDYPLVPTIGNIFAPIVLFCLAQCQDALLLMMLWTAPPPARECHGCGCC